MYVTSRWSWSEDLFIIIFLYCSEAPFSYPRGFIVVVVVDCVHAADVVGAGDAVGHGDVTVVARGSVAALLVVQEAQREQAQVGLVPQVAEAEVGVVAVGGALFVGRRLLVTVDAAAQKLLVLRRRVIFTAHKGKTLLNTGIIHYVSFQYTTEFNMRISDYFFFTL